MLRDRVFVIAEAGVNHNGDLNRAFELIDVAAEAGADAVKFQTFSTEKLVTRSALKAPYQIKDANPGESQFEMLSNLELDYEAHHALKEYAEDNNLQFMSTAFDSSSLKFLVDDLQLAVLKIPSGEITNGPLLIQHARSDRDLIISTGMSTIEEILQALSVVSFGLVSKKDPSKEACQEVFNTEEGQQQLRDRVILLHCTSEYPASIDGINLSAMVSIRDKFSLRVGYSDHSEGIAIPPLAVALGAQVVEKHFTLDRTLPGPDHAASLEPKELKEMVTAIRVVERVLGNGVKEPAKGEKNNREAARKSLVAARIIHKGEKFSADNLTAKRPGNGRSPMDYWSLIGKHAEKHYEADEFI